MDRLSQALAAGFNAPVVYINRLTGFWLHLRRSARCVISRWQWGPTELIAGGQERQWVLGRDLFRRVTAGAAGFLSLSQAAGGAEADNKCVTGERTCPNSRRLFRENQGDTSLFPQA
jgi:hypothetical protein